MFDISKITDLSNIMKKYFISDINFRDSDNVIVLYIPNDRISEKANPGYVSKTQLENLANKLSNNYSVSTEIIYVNTKKLDEIGQGVEILLKAKFEDIIEEANFTFLTANKVNAWLKSKTVDEVKEKEIKIYLKSIFFDSGIQHVDIQWIGELEKLPSFIELLVMTKRLQPVLLDTYILKFSVDYQNINEKWLNRQLDKLIKKGLIVRDSITKKYSLTGKGLGVIPNVFSRNNSDIIRALDLGRREW
ncbi:hypothetical protein [Vreelandella titanicae]|uniref:hypothetical protein n=1 Tax=Vreelandella titanicae TaxID=664683 RepID=UPI003FD80C35